jgi:hypothetical protein
VETTVQLFLSECVREVYVIAASEGGGNLRDSGAYEVNPRLIEGIPRDLAWATFNVEAKADGETDVKLATLTKEQIRLEIRL